MSERTADSLTLREKLIEAEKLARELADHLEKGFIPKLQSLRRVAHKGSSPETQDEVRDVSVRSAVSQVLQTDDYTRKLANWGAELLTSIEREVKAVVEEGS